MNSSSWSRDETKQLLQLVQREQQDTNTIEWDGIARALGKTRSQCQKKYLKIINFNTSDSERYHEWSEAEKDILIECVQIYGKDWEKIASRFFTWMTPLKLKNKHYALTKGRPQPRSPAPSAPEPPLQRSASESQVASPARGADGTDEKEIYEQIRLLLQAGA